MPYPTLQDYLSHLPQAPNRADNGMWLDERGRVQGRYFSATLASVFQPIRDLASGEAAGFEGFVRSYDTEDSGLSVWNLLDHAAADRESVELDRICRMLHAINFFRQQESEGASLFLNVHSRLLTGVESDHGAAFRRVLEALGLPQERVVLQLPQVGEAQAWLLSQVADNYRRNGFSLALKAASVDQAIALVDKVRPQYIKLDARDTPDAAALHRLVAEAERRGVQLVFKRVESGVTQAVLNVLGSQAQLPLLVQGYLWDRPAASLVATRRTGADGGALSAVF